MIDTIAQAAPKKNNFTKQLIPKDWEVISEDIDSPKKDDEEEDGSGGDIAEFIIQLSSNDDGDTTSDKIVTLGCKWQHQRGECCMQRQNIGSEQMSAAKPSWELQCYSTAKLNNKSKKCSF